MKKLYFLTCEQLSPYFKQAIKNIGYLDIIEYDFYPCVYSESRNRLEVDSILHKIKDIDRELFLLCGRFCTLPQLISKDINIKIIKRNFCFSYILNDHMVEYILRHGGYIITCHWLKNWKRYIEKMGFSTQDARKFFQGICRELVVPTLPEQASETKIKADELSNYLKIPYFILKIDLTPLENFLKSIIWDRKIRELEPVILEKSNKIAEYAALFDILDQLIGSETFEAVYEKIQELFIEIMGAAKFKFHRGSEFSDPRLKKLITDFKKKNNKIYLKKKDKFYILVHRKGKIYGIIEVSNFLFPQHIDRYLNFATLIAPVFALVLNNIDNFEKLKNMAIKDDLTNIYNRRYFIEKLEQEINRVKRGAKTFSLIFFDIDFFKNINDKFGHSIGDYILTALANEVKNRIRKSDVFVRWGGEEFIIMLPRTCLRDAVGFAEQLRQLVKKIRIPGTTRSITVSFGVVEYIKGESLDNVITRADEKMYLAKKSGRDNVKY